MKRGIGIMELAKKLRMPLWLVMVNTALALAIIILKEMGIK